MVVHLKTKRNWIISHFHSFLALLLYDYDPLIGSSKKINDNTLMGSESKRKDYLDLLIC